MRIRRAEDDADLLAAARIFTRSAGYLVERYRPEQIGHFDVDPESRLPLYRHLLATGSFLLGEDPDPVGFSAAVVRDGVWYLSQLWVLPDHHASGIGSSLLDRALEWGEGSRAYSVISSPHPAAQIMYLRASMFPLWVQHEMTGNVGPEPQLPVGFQALTDADQPWLDELDREVRGLVRPQDHAFWREEASGLALRRDGRPAGYVYARPGGKVGPAAADLRTDVPLLLRAGRHEAGASVTVAVPSTNWMALKELVGLGFAPTGYSTFLASRSLGDASRYISSGGALG